jgi:arsenate reductase
MAEGLLRALGGERFEAFSAGTVATRVNPYVIKGMSEIGIDITSHRSKTVDEFAGMEFDYVVTVCDNAREACPYFPGAGKLIHHSFPDPSAFTGGEEEVMAGVRAVCGQIKDWIARTFMAGEVDYEKRQ